MAKEEGQRRRLYKKLKNKYRLVLMDDENFEEKLSMILSPLNVFTWGGLTVIVLMALVAILIAFTPLREFIPGYTNPILQRNAMYAALKADSLEQEKRQNEHYINNIKALFEDKTIRPDIVNKDDTIINYENITLEKSKEDSVLRAEIEAEDKYNLIFNEEHQSASKVSGFFFFTPLRGIVSQSFNINVTHY